MGKRVDRWVLGAALTAGLYIFFLNAWDSIPLACAAAFACCALARRFGREHPIKRHVPSAEVSARLLRIASLPEAEAQAELTALVRGRYPQEAFELTGVLKHPEASLTSGDVLNAWKACRDADRLVIAATCPCEPRAALFARQLRSPRVAVVDSRALARMIRAQGASSEATPIRPLSLRQRLSRCALRFAAAHVTPKNALLAASLLALYLRYGNALYLFCALAMLFHLGAALLGGRMGRRLFEPD